uniref:Uncharacterized protein n=1 Tax=Anguilla anguilla TaxID=7936 RepID=A0A0E9VAJ7_ANGAN
MGSSSNGLMVSVVKFACHG